MAFSIAFDLPFADAIASAKRRGVMLPDSYYSTIQRVSKTDSFSVSDIASIEQIQSVLDRLTSHLETGGTLRDFQQWAKTQDFDLPDHRLETIYRNGIQTAYNAGHWRRFEENKATRPYLMYDSINDGRTRPAHKALSGIIRPVDDPFWSDHSPPLGHRCRCRLVSLSPEQAESRSRDGRGLHMPETPDMRADKGGWGAKPDELGRTLEKIKAEKLAKLEKANDRLKSIAVKVQEVTKEVVKDPVTIDDFISYGRSITESLPEGEVFSTDCFDALMKKMNAEIGISTQCEVASEGEGAKLVREASKRIPDSWTKATDDFGRLQVNVDSKGRGWHITLIEDKENPLNKNAVNIRDFRAVVTKDHDGYIGVVSGDKGNALHEYTHRMQSAMPELDKMFQDLHKRRTNGDPLEKLKDLEPELSYHENELTRKDKYINPYQGKEYGENKAKEMMTLSLEWVLGYGTGANPERIQKRMGFFREFYSKDREMFDFTVGLLFGWKP